MPLKLAPPRQGWSPNWTVRGTYMKVHVNKTSGTSDEAVARKVLEKIERDIEHGALKGSESKSKRRPAPSRDGFVYFLRTKEQIKIGFSKHPAKRFDTLRTGLPHEIKSFAAVRGTFADEQRLHRELAAHNLTGEWFRAHPTIAKIVMRWITFGRPMFDD